MNTTAKKTAPKADTFTTAKIADGAREYVTRTAVSAKERTESAYESAQKFNAGLEKTLTRVATGYVSVLSDLAEATRANLVHSLATVEKVAQAKTFTEAAQIQVDAARELATANYDRIRSAFAQGRAVVTEGVDAVRETVAEIVPAAQKAA